jgi:L-malate glycosyltransferase
MNVLHCIDTLSRGGSELLLLESCRNSLRHGITPFICASGGGELELSFRKEGIPVFRFDRTSMLDTSLISFLRSIILEYQIDIVHGHQLVSTLHALKATESSRGRIPVVHSVHGITTDIKNKLLFPYIINRTDANILVSNALEGMLISNEYVRSIPNKYVVYNGVDESRFIATSSNLRSELGISEYDIVIGMTGNFFDTKDQLTVCRAVKELHDSNTKVHCLFAGNPSDVLLFDDCKDYVKRNGLSDYVHFLGKRQDINEFLNTLDVFVFSTLADSFGLSLVEAMMAGVPCVANDIPSMIEISHKGRIARLFKTKNSIDCALNIKQALQSDYTSVTKQAKITANKWFSISAHVSSMKSVYLQLLGRKESRTISSERMSESYADHELELFNV